jgi:hypothetical protein
MIQSMARSSGRRRQVTTPIVASTNADARARDRMGSPTAAWISRKAPSLAVQCSE